MSEEKYYNFYNSLSSWRLHFSSTRWFCGILLRSCAKSNLCSIEKDLVRDLNLLKSESPSASVINLTFKNKMSTYTIKILHVQKLFDNFMNFKQILNRIGRHLGTEVKRQFRQKIKNIFKKILKFILNVILSAHKPMKNILNFKMTRRNFFRETRPVFCRHDKCLLSKQFKVCLAVVCVFYKQIKDNMIVYFIAGIGIILFELQYRSVGIFFSWKRYSYLWYCPLNFYFIKILQNIIIISTEQSMFYLEKAIQK